MTDLLNEVEYGRVLGSFTAVAEDFGETVAPDAIPLNGKITFNPTKSNVSYINSAGETANLYVAPVQATISNGRIIGKDGRDGVVLLASNSNNVSASVLWNARISLNPVVNGNEAPADQDFLIEVRRGEVVSLIDVIKATSLVHNIALFNDAIATAAEKFWERVEAGEFRGNQGPPGPAGGPGIGMPGPVGTPGRPGVDGAPGVGGNLIADGDLESPGFLVAGDYTESNDALSGSKSASITEATSRKILLEPEKSYIGSVYIKSPTATSVSVDLRVFGPEGDISRVITNAYNIPVDTWRKVTFLLDSEVGDQSVEIITRTDGRRVLVDNYFLSDNSVVAGLQKDLSAAQAQLEAAMADLDVDLANVDAERERLAKSLNDLAVVLEDANVDLSEVEAEIADLNEDLATEAQKRFDADQAAQILMQQLDQNLSQAKQDLADNKVILDNLDSDLTTAKQELEEAEQSINTLETVTLPNLQQILTEADQAAQDKLATLDGKIATAQGELDTAKDNITQLGTDLSAESVARQQLASDTQTTFTQLDTRLATFSDDEALAPIRQALTDAQNAVDAAQQVATEANNAANAASQAALEAAGIAASKGRVIVSETEPTGEDRTPSNIWIQPVPDDPDTDVEEKAVTYVYLEATDEWQPTTSSELAQAAQNALDAREAAQQAQQRADTAIANAASAKAAADAAEATAQRAQQTADGKNTVTYSTAQPSGSGKSDGDIWWQYDSKSNIQGQWVWKASASQWISRPFRSEVIANLDVGKLTAGSLSTPDAVIGKLWADGIAARSVASSRVVVSSGNVYRDPELADPATWNGYYSPEAQWAPTGGYGGGGSITATARTGGSVYTYDLANNPDGKGRTRVKPGTTYAAGAWVKTTDAASGTEIRMYLRWHDGDTTEDFLTLTSLGAGTVPAGEWVHVDFGTATAPAGATHLSIAAYLEAGTRTVTFSDFSITPLVGAVLIEDGAVSADKINAESVAAAIGQFVKVETSNLIATDSIKTPSAVIDKLWTDGISAKAITAGRLIVGDAGISEWEWVSADDWGEWNYYRAASGWSLANGTAKYAGNGTDGTDHRLMGDYHPSAPDEVWQISVDVENRDKHPLALSVGGYRSSGGSYSSSIWVDASEKELEAKGRKTFHVTVPFSGASSNEEGFAPVLYFRNSNKSGGRSVIVHSVRVMRRTPSGSVLIEDGAVNASKINAESVGAAVGEFVKLDVKNLTASSANINSLVAQRIAAGTAAFQTVNADKIVASTGTMNSATINQIWADGIAAKSLTASKVVVSGTNLVPNPYFDDGAYGWNPHQAGPGSTATSSDAAYPGHANGVSLAPYTSGNSTIYGPILDYRSAYDASRIAVTPGETYTITAWVKRTAGSVPSDRIDLRVYAYDGLTHGSLHNGTAGARMKASDFEPEQWVKIGGDYTVPAGKYALTPRFTLYPDADWTPDAAVWHIGHYSVIRKVGAVLIEDGAVSANHISSDSVDTNHLRANAVSAEKIVSGAVTTDKMTANSINGDRITANTLNASKITSNSITASKIASRTISAAEIKSRTITANEIVANTITSNEIKARTITAAEIATGTIQADNISSTTIDVLGELTVQKLSGEHIYGTTIEGGEFLTTSSLPGQVRIADDALLYAGRRIPGIEIVPEDTQYTVIPAGVGPWGTGAALLGGEDTSGRSAKLHATPTQAGITSTSTIGDAHIYAGSTGVTMNTTRTSDGDSGNLSVGYTGANLTATDGESGEYGRIMANPRDLSMSLRDGSGNVTGNIRVTRNSAYLESGSGKILVSNSSTKVTGTLSISEVPTTSLAVNARVAPTGGMVYAVTSSRRYKKNIVDWNPDSKAVLALQPRQWQHDDPNFPEEIDERWHVGFVAEEVHDLGLKGLVEYSGDGRGGWRPQSLNYDRFAAAHQVVLKKHEAEIKELLERIAILEAKIGAE